ncbi:MAG: hypothetical protein U0441_10770 [Polyangiaceae bacterium]
MAAKKTTPKPASSKGKLSNQAAAHSGAEDPDAPQKAFDSFLSEMKALPKSAVIAVNTDLQEASIRALAVAELLAQEEPRARFALLHPQLFNPDHLARLRPLALAVGHAHVELQTARAQSTEALLPAPLVAEVTAVRSRMIGRAKYVFQFDPALSAEVQSINLGNSYRDYASHLVRLANLYRDHPNEVSGDKLLYRATDEVDARHLAARITRELGKSQSLADQKWSDLAARAWTLLRPCYDEIYAAGHFLYRSEDPESKFPTLYAGNSSGRKTTSTPAESTAFPAESASSPADGAPPTDAPAPEKSKKNK